MFVQLCTLQWSQTIMRHHIIQPQLLALTRLMLKACLDSSPDLACQHAARHAGTMSFSQVMATLQLYMQAEHSQALRQEQDRLSAVKADYEAQLSGTQQQLADVRKAADQACMAETHARQAQEESRSTVLHLQVHMICDHAQDTT